MVPLPVGMVAAVVVLVASLMWHQAVSDHQAVPMWLQSGAATWQKEAGRRAMLAPMVSRFLSETGDYHSRSFAPSVG